MRTAEDGVDAGCTAQATHTSAGGAIDLVQQPAPRVCAPAGPGQGVNTVVLRAVPVPAMPSVMLT